MYHGKTCHVCLTLVMTVLFLIAQLTMTHAQPSPASPLTSQQMRKIDLMLDKAGTVDLNPELTRSLGLTQGKQTLTVRQLSVGNAAGWGFHWNRIPNSTDILLLMREADDTVHAYLLASDLRIRNALVAKPYRGHVAIPNDTAQRELAGNLRVWARYADQRTMP
jgi:hypothetical protein